jgi:benzaldehyde dehydrogenase (NAD)
MSSRRCDPGGRFLQVEGILTTDIMSGLALAERVPVAHPSKTSTHEPIAPFGGVGLWNGHRTGGQQANLDAFTEIQWIRVNLQTGSCPF